MSETNSNKLDRILTKVNTLSENQAGIEQKLDDVCLKITRVRKETDRNRKKADRNRWFIALGVGAAMAVTTLIDLFL